MDDSLGWPGGCPTRPTSMAVGGAAYVCSYSRVAPTIPGSAVTMDYINTYTVDGNEILATTDGATVTVEKPPADLQVLKSVSVYQLGNDGDGVPTFGIADTITISRSTLTPNVSVWFRLTVTNVGGQTASGLAVTDTQGSLPVNANCPAVPSTLAVNATWTCRYQNTYNSDQVDNNTVTATGTNVAPDAGDTHTATVTVATCGGSNQSIPIMAGVDKTAALARWTAAGYNVANVTSWSGGGSTNVDAQDVRAFTCAGPISSTITIYRNPTP